MALYRVHNGSTRGNHLEMMKVSPRNREEKLIMRVLEEVSQRGCEICILGGLQDPAGQSPETPGLISQFSGL